VLLVEGQAVSSAKDARPDDLLDRHRSALLIGCAYLFA
jgi:hypothetical protein